MLTCPTCVVRRPSALGSLSSIWLLRVTLAKSRVRLELLTFGLLLVCGVFVRSGSDPEILAETLDRDTGVSCGGVGADLVRVTPHAGISHNGLIHTVSGNNRTEGDYCRR